MYFRIYHKNDLEIVWEMSVPITADTLVRINSKSDTVIGVQFASVAIRCAFYTSLIPQNVMVFYKNDLEGEKSGPLKDKK